MCSQCAQIGLIVHWPSVYSRSSLRSFALTIQKALTVRSMCVQTVFTFHLAFVQRLLIAQSDQIIFRQITINTNSLFVISSLTTLNLHYLRLLPRRLLLSLLIISYVNIWPPIVPRPITLWVITVITLILHYMAMLLQSFPDWLISE